MFGLSSHDAFFVGIAVLWIFSAGVSAMEEPGAASSSFYKWLYKFLKLIAGDLKSRFGQYLPQESPSPSVVPSNPKT